MPLGHSCPSATFWTRPFGDTDGSKKPKAGRGHLQIGGSRSNPAEHLMATRLRYPRSLKTLCDSMGLVLPKNPIRSLYAFRSLAPLSHHTCRRCLRLAIRTERKYLITTAGGGVD